MLQAGPLPHHHLLPGVLLRPALPLVGVRDAVRGRLLVLVVLAVAGRPQLVVPLLRPQPHRVRREQHPKLRLALHRGHPAQVVGAARHGVLESDNRPAGFSRLSINMFQKDQDAVRCEHDF